MTSHSEANLERGEPDLLVSKRREDGVFSNLPLTRTPSGWGNSPETPTFQARLRITSGLTVARVETVWPVFG